METADIIQAIQNNKSRILMKALYKTALPPIITYIKQKRGSKSDAEDCFQEAVLALIKKVKLNEYDEKFEIKNYLFVIARNIWFNKLKRNGKFSATDIDDFDIRDNTMIGDEKLLQSERQEAIQTWLNSVGERCKKLFHLILFENKKMKEVAEIMEFSSDEVVKTNHYRCKKKLKEALKHDARLMSILKP